MLIPPKYTLTKEITELLTEIEAARAVIDATSVPVEIETNIRRQTTLQSSLFSARVEGNTLTLNDLTPGSTVQKKAEVFNLLKALEWLRERERKDITLTELLTMHKIAMKGLTPDAGKMRNEVSAIFNQAGIAIYMPPPPKQAHKYLEKLLKYASSDKERFAPIRAVLVHYAFEKIHPFLDGNGRCGRLLLQKVLMQSGYGMKGLIVFEEYLDTHRSEYYRSLEEPEKEVTDYVVFMLTALKESAQKAMRLIERKQDFEPEDMLLPRRGEIIRIIKDQQMISLNMLSRRFPGINPRTLRNDMQRLVEGGFVKKLGTTKGAYYTLPKTKQ